MNLKFICQNIFIVCYILMVAVTFSCNSQTQSNKRIPSIHSKIDSTRVKYKTGVRSILEDSKGNIWFGVSDAGNWKYDGSAMKNYSIKDGPTSDFALSIYEDINGELWFVMVDGSIYKLNGQTFEKQF